jgi:hypothetical protein
MPDAEFPLPFRLADTCPRQAARCQGQRHRR